MENCFNIFKQKEWNEITENLCICCNSPVLSRRPRFEGTTPVYLVLPEISLLGIILA